MKKLYLAILMAAAAFVGCTQKPMVEEEPVSTLPMYYAYNPQDTVGNELYWQLLKIDSARVEYLSECPRRMVPRARIEEMECKDSSQVLLEYDDDQKQAFDDYEASWYELMWLCSQKQYEDMLDLYRKEEYGIKIATATSTNMFALDYFVIGELLFSQMDGDEALELLSKSLEYDRLLAESVVLFSTADGGSGYIPPQYAFQIDVLCETYILLEEREKAESLIEPYRQAVYLLSDDTLMNEGNITKFKTRLYAEFGDEEKYYETVVEFRDFLIQYAEDNDEDYDEEIEEINEIIRERREKIYT